MVIVLDNARYRHARLLGPLLLRYRKVMELLFLPPYSPQLAPIERVWKLTRRLATHNQYFATLDGVLAAVKRMAKTQYSFEAIMRHYLSSVAAMILVEEGKLQLSDPVAKHLPAFKDHRNLLRQLVYQAVAD